VQQQTTFTFISSAL